MFINNPIGFEPATNRVMSSIPIWYMFYMCF